MAYKTIMVIGDGLAYDMLGSGAITPGHLLYVTNSTTEDTVAVHASAGQDVVPVIVAVEDDLQGKEIGDAYTTANRVQCRVLRSGEQFYGLIANGQSITKGDKLESAGDGTLRKHTADSAGVVEYPDAIVGIAMETVDMSDSSGADPSGRCRVMVR